MQDKQVIDVFRQKNTWNTNKMRNAQGENEMKHDNEIKDE